VINFMQLQPGQRLKLRDGRVGSVVENMGDGIWVQVAMTESDGDEPELVHCEEVAGLADSD